MKNLIKYLPLILVGGLVVESCLVGPDCVKAKRKKGWFSYENPTREYNYNFKENYLNADTIAIKDSVKNLDDCM